MDKQKKKAYEAPGLTAVTFRNEHGYALSMKFNAVAHNEYLADNGEMDAERQSYGWSESNNGSWF